MKAQKENRILDKSKSCETVGLNKQYYLPVSRGPFVDKENVAKPVLRRQTFAGPFLGEHEPILISGL